MGGKDMYDGAVVMKIEFMSAFSGDTSVLLLSVPFCPQS